MYLKEFLIIILIVAAGCDSHPPLSKEMKAAKADLQEENKRIKGFLDFARSLSHISFSVQSIPATDSIQNDISFKPKPYRPRPEAEIKKAFKNYFEGLAFRQYKKDDSSLIRFGFYKPGLSEIIPNYRKYVEENEKIDHPWPIFKLRSITYEDATTETFKDTMKEGSITVPSANKAQRILVDVTYNYPVDTKTYLLSADNKKVELPEGALELKSIDGDEVQVMMPDTVQHRVVAVEGVYKNGKVMDNVGSSSRNLPTEEKILFLENLVEANNEAVQKIDAGDLKNEEELKSYLQKELPEPPKNDENVLFISYRFPAQVEKINIILASGKFKTESLRITSNRYQSEVF